MASLFEAQINQWITKAKGNIDLVVRKVALEMFSRVIQKSPVSTGRFKGNWQVAIGNIPYGTLDLTDPSGTATMSAVDAAVLGLKAGDIIYLVNNLSYAERLEYGWSKQAPQGMVRTTIQEFSAVVQAAASSP